MYKLSNFLSPLMTPSHFFLSILELSYQFFNLIVSTVEISVISNPGAQKQTKTGFTQIDVDWRH